MSHLRLQSEYVYECADSIALAEEPGEVVCVSLEGRSVRLTLDGALDLQLRLARLLAQIEMRQLDS